MTTESYKQERVYLGISDIAALTVTACGTQGVFAEILRFGGDGEYYAYVVRDKKLIPPHYHTVLEVECFCQFYNLDGTRGKVLPRKTWLKIFDDSGRMTEFRGIKITIMRAGDYGLLIHLED